MLLDLEKSCTEEWMKEQHRSEFICISAEMDTKEDENVYILHFRDAHPFLHFYNHSILFESFVYLVVLNVSRVYQPVDQHRHIRILQYNHRNELFYVHEVLK